MGRQLAEHHDDKTIIECAYLYAASGNYSKVSRQTNIKRTSIMDWGKNSEVWVTAVDKARQEISDELLAQNLAIATAANDRILETIDTADCRAAAIVSGIMQDKARVQLGLATSISGKAESKEELLKKFAAIAQEYNKNVVSVQDDSQVIDK